MSDFKSTNIFRDAGATNVSEDAIHQLDEVIQNYALYIAKGAQAIARHSGRNTIEAVDVRLAFMNVSLGRLGIIPGVQTEVFGKGPGER